jgi:murein L,D-transpeptidase YafK
MMNVRHLSRIRILATALLAVLTLSFLSSGPAIPGEIAPQADGPVDRIVVEKAKRTLTLYRQEREFKSYRIALGRDPVGPKTRQGDQKTPEGLYYVDYKVPNSIYHRALHLSYPNQEDIERARELGVPPGGSIMIHGMKEDKLWMGDVQYLFNWTNGCIALTNREMEEIWDMVPPWTPVEIKP